MGVGRQENQPCNWRVGTFCSRPPTFRRVEGPGVECSPMDNDLINVPM